MSSAVFSTSAAQGRPFIFEEDIAKVRPQPSEAELLVEGRPPGRVPIAEFPADPRLSGVTPASRLEVHPAPVMASSGIAAIDALTGGLPRGCLTEICGPASSGRTTLLLAALAAATRRGEFCVVIDASDAIDPHSVAAAGVDLDRLLWVRCGEDPPQKRTKTSQAAFKFSQTRSPHAESCLEQLLRATDLLLESGGFGLIVLDLCNVTPQAARRIPLTTWFRFRRAVEHKSTVLLALEQHPIAGSCSCLLLKLGPAITPKLSNLDACNGSNIEMNLEESTAKACPELVEGRRKNAAHGASRGSDVRNETAPEGRKNSGSRDSSTASQFVMPAHAQLLTELEITASLDRSRFERKPARSISAAFVSKTAWAG